MLWTIKKAFLKNKPRRTGHAPRDGANMNKKVNENEKEKEKEKNALVQAIATNSAQFRRKKDWSQAQAAEQAGIAVRTYAELESYKTVPALETVIHVAHTYGVTVSELIGEVPCSPLVQTHLDTINTALHDLNRYLLHFFPKK